MTNTELIQRIVLRLKKFRWLILLGGMITGAAGFFYARSVPPVYSVTSSMYPLTNAKEISNSVSGITAILGGASGGAKSISEEANVNIEEVGKSRKVREAVCSERLPSRGNQTIARALIAEYNDKRGFKPAIPKPVTEEDAVSKASLLLAGNYTFKPNKNNLLQLTVSSTDPSLLEPLSLLMAEKIALFYTELKVEKAKADYDFIRGKVDSLDQELTILDRKRIYANEHGLFVPQDRLRYTVPQENIENEKMRVWNQKSGTAANREEALWRLQKVTPIIKIMDRPQPPYAVAKPSSVVYGAAGFFIGCLLVIIACVVGILYKYAGTQVNNALFPTSNTTIAS